MLNSCTHQKVHYVCSHQGQLLVVWWCQHGNMYVSTFNWSYLFTSESATAELQVTVQTKRWQAGSLGYLPESWQQVPSYSQEDGCSRSALMLMAQQPDHVDMKHRCQQCHHGSSFHRSQAPLGTIAVLICSISLLLSCTIHSACGEAMRPPDLRAT